MGKKKTLIVPYFDEAAIFRASKGYWLARLKAFFRIGGWRYHKGSGTVIKSSSGCYKFEE